MRVIWICIKGGVLDSRLSSLRMTTNIDPMEFRCKCICGFFGYPRERLGIVLVKKRRRGHVQVHASSSLTSSED